MAAVTQVNIWKGLKLYLVPGMLIGGVKLVSVAGWFLAALAGQVGTNYVAGDFLGILLMSLGGVALAIIGWPIVLYNVLTGAASLPVVLLFPWVTNL
jgi:hypothetical protein